jgi:hypothetical protein
MYIYFYQNLDIGIVENTMPQHTGSLCYHFSPIPALIFCPVVLSRENQLMNAST